MHYPKAYIEYLLHFHGSRDWFECHEIMEEVWKAETLTERKQWWLTLVQIAVGLYHERRGNVAGAHKMLTKALSHSYQVPWLDLGLKGQSLLDELRTKLSTLRAIDDRSVTMNYRELDLPFADLELVKHCKEHCEQRGWTWCYTNSRAVDAIVHRHKHRNRQDVIDARARAYRMKQNERKRRLR